MSKVSQSQKDLDRSLQSIETGVFQIKYHTIECIYLCCAAKVSIAYLLSADFAQLAEQRTGKDDPSFIDTWKVMSKRLIANTSSPTSFIVAFLAVKDIFVTSLTCTAAKDMKTAFWLSDKPIGQDIICPRDGRAGCALVDWIPRRERREQTHFMSWTWRYSLQQAHHLFSQTVDLPISSYCSSLIR